MGVVQSSLTFHSTHSFRRQFYGSDEPTNNVTAVKDDGSSTRLRSLQGKI